MVSQSPVVAGDKYHRGDTCRVDLRRGGNPYRREQLRPLILKS